MSPVCLEGEPGLGPNGPVPNCVVCSGHEAFFKKNVYFAYSCIFWISWYFSDVELIELNLLGHFGDFLDTLLLWGTTCARVNSLFTGVISLSVYVKVKLPLMTSLCPIKGHVNTRGDTRFCKLFHSFHETWNLWTGWRIYLPESGVSRKHTVKLVAWSLSSLLCNISSI